MNGKLKRTYELVDKIFPNISKYCNTCKACCKTYGWLLKQESERFSKKGYPIVEINKNFYCFDSFIQNKNNKRILDQIPRCLFYKKDRCLIYQERPLDCRLYPIKVKFNQNRAIIGLSLGCKYISSLTEKGKEQLCYDIIRFFKRAPQDIINDYLNLMEGIYFISKPKSFLMRRIMEMRKEGDFWKIVE